MILNVTDTGRWVPPTANSERGRGIAIEDVLADRVAIDRRESGTSVTLHHTLNRTNDDGPTCAPLRLAKPIATRSRGSSVRSTLECRIHRPRLRAIELAARNTFVIDLNRSNTSTAPESPRSST
jgi:hypothetical protein